MYILILTKDRKLHEKFLRIVQMYHKKGIGTLWSVARNVCQTNKKDCVKECTSASLLWEELAYVTRKKKLS